jgi:anaerobic selenocysteine-containing dehydrogenase
VLIGRRHLRTNNSWGQNVPSLTRGRDLCTLQMHPADAEQRGLEDGKPARVTSRVGEVTVTVELTDDLRPGVVSLPHGFGHDLDGVGLSVARRKPGANTNVLTDPALLDRVSGTAVLNGIPVQVAAV